MPLHRIRGKKVAEVPLVGTRFQFRRLGMCHAVMNALEKVNFHSCQASFNFTCPAIYTTSDLCLCLLLSFSVSAEAEGARSGANRFACCS